MVNDSYNVKKKAAMMKNNLLKYFVLISVFLVSTHSIALDINVSVDRNPVSINESFKLIFSLEESPDDDPDFSPLDNKFEVLNQQKSSQSSWVNGRSTKSISWTLDVMAKQTGPQKIPAISFGDDVSKALSITVLANSTSDKVDIDDDLYLQVEVSPEQPYVQSQLLYTVRLFQRVQISKASLSEPTIDNAIVEKIGEDKQYNKQLNGVNYSVFERKYAIFPQQSGPLTIPPTVLTAQVVTGAGRSWNGSLFNTQRTKTKRVQSKAVNVDVQPAPASFTGEHWLAAKSVHLQQTWSNDELSVTVGEPLTRTLTMLARGVTASQLPELNTDTASSQLKVYPDQPLLRIQSEEDGVIALREQKAAIIPAKAGDYTLPAIEVPWFNTITGRIETAVIPEMTITAVALESVEIPQVIATEPNQKLVTEIDRLDQAATVNTTEHYWKWLAIIFAIAWLITLVWVVIKGRFRRSSSSSIDEENSSVKKAIKDLQQACKANDPKESKKALITWGFVQFNSKELDQISRYCSKELQAEIEQLNQALYSNNDIEWKGEDLAGLVNEHSQRLQKRDKRAECLEPLHKL